MLFETSPDAYKLIKAVQKSDVWLYGYSIGAKIYSMMPNDTDLTVFLKEGYNGLNFSAVEGVEVYHTMDDSYDNINYASAWHYLHTNISLSDYAANSSLEDLKNPSREAIFSRFCRAVLCS